MVLICIFVVAFGYFFYTNNKVPKMYRQGVLKLKNEMENLEKIPLVEKKMMSFEKNGGYTFFLDYKKRTEFVNKHKDVWNEIFMLFNKLIMSKDLNEWMDDALFCRALAYTTVASVDNAMVSIEDVLSSSSDFIKFKNNTKIENWTKKQLKTVFWDKTGKFFSDSLSEKTNLDAFFHIGRGSILQHRKGNLNRALEEYRRVLMLDPNGFWGKQAFGQIELIKEEKKGN